VDPICGPGQGCHWYILDPAAYHTKQGLKLRGTALVVVGPSRSKAEMAVEPNKVQSRRMQLVLIDLENEYILLNFVESYF
jgi:hypothetical protein